MPRTARLETTPGVFHVFARGNDRREIFADDTDRRAYLARLRQVIASQRWRCLSYCLMPNHVHLLIETTSPNLGTGMHRLHGQYARRFNARHRRTGHLFEGRYGAVAIEDDAQMWMVVGYIARNPVAARLCDAPAEWPWSSHGAVLSPAPPSWLDAARLLEYLAPTGKDPHGRYRDCVEPDGEAEMAGAPRTASATSSRRAGSASASVRVRASA